MQDGLKQIPTAQELVKMGLAEVFERNKKGEPIAFVISSYGYKLIYDAMKYNAKLLASDSEMRKESESLAVRNAKNMGGNK